ncbi:MAG TPA: arginine deiminase-related protein [Chryseosolibacter sp.]
MNFQQPHTLLMIRPKSFGFNQQTESSNAFQQQGNADLDCVKKEFSTMVDLLLAHEVPVVVFDDTPNPTKPDAIFPNNWISFHEDGKVILYPMFAENRRHERRLDIVDQLKQNFQVREILDFSDRERGGGFLEGTGSIVFDHLDHIAYACRSPRTTENVLMAVCKQLKYRSIVFDAVDESGRPVYHTNVMMNIGEKFAVVCIDSITKDADQEIVIGSLAESGRKLVAISFAQMRAFAGNMLEVKTRTGENVVLMSDTALNSLLPGQINAISQFSEVLPISIPTIERVGGGGVRCMVAGIHLPPRK